MIVNKFSCNKGLVLNYSLPSQLSVKRQKCDDTTVVPAKSDSDVMFCLQRIRDLGSIDHLCINPIHRIGLILK